MGTSATIRCGNRVFGTYMDGYVRGIGHDLSNACNAKSGAYDTLGEFADYLANEFNIDYRQNIEENLGGGDYYYNIEMTGPGGFWVSVVLRDGTCITDADDEFWE